MKIRHDFVTNSSSSSFLISKKYLDDDQVKAIREHHKLGKKMGMVNSWLDFPWEIKENDNFMHGYTDMDNFDMEEFLEQIDVDTNRVEWSEWRQDLPEEDDKDWRTLLYED